MLVTAPTTHWFRTSRNSYMPESEPMSYKKHACFEPTFFKKCLAQKCVWVQVGARPWSFFFRVKQFIHCNPPTKAIKSARFKAGTPAGAPGTEGPSPPKSTRTVRSSAAGCGPAAARARRCGPARPDALRAPRRRPRSARRLAAWPSAPVAAPGLPHGRQQPRPNRLGRELGAKDALGDGRQPLDQLIFGPRSRASSRRPRS